MININVELFCVSVKNHADEKNAKNAAEKLNLPLNLYNLTFDEVESKIPEIIWSIEEINPLKVSIAIPFFFLAREAKKAGFNHMILGQGADELFPPQPVMTVTQGSKCPGSVHDIRLWFPIDVSPPLHDLFIDQDVLGMHMHDRIL